MPDTLKEGARWRYAKPTAEEVVEWFRSVPLDEGMTHDQYVSGVVLIPASEKVKRPKEDGNGTEERWEQTFTPYVRVDTRVAYFRNLAALKSQIAVIEPVAVPQLTDGAFKNDNMPPGFWWFIAGEREGAERFLCCTMRVALYEQEAWFAADTDEKDPRASREGTATKQITGRPDINALARAETGAVGRALGMAGILVVGTGIATADDMADLGRDEEGAPVELPEVTQEQSDETLSARLIELQGQLRQFPDAWAEFSAWWKERAEQGGWHNALIDPPIEVRRGIAGKMVRLLEAAQDLEEQQEHEQEQAAEGNGD